MAAVRAYHLGAPFGQSPYCLTEELHRRVRQTNLKPSVPNEGHALNQPPIFIPSCICATRISETTRIPLRDRESAEPHSQIFLWCRLETRPRKAQSCWN